MNYYDVNSFAKERYNEMIERAENAHRWQKFAHTESASPLERLSTWWENMTRRKPQRQLKRSR